MTEETVTETPTETPTTPNPTSSTAPEPTAPTTTQQTDAAPAGAPETYAEFTAPKDTTLDKDAIAAALPMFKELNLTQEQAQKVVNAQAERDNASRQKAIDHYNGVREGWRNEVTKEYGNNLEPMRQTIAQALDSFPADTRQNFAEALALTGAGDNPAFIKVFYGLAKQVTEGKAVAAAPPTPAPERKGFASSLYPNLS